MIMYYQLFAIAFYVTTDIAGFRHLGALCRSIQKRKFLGVLNLPHNFYFFVPGINNEILVFLSCAF